MRRLIINADDFGLTAGVDRAIAEAHAGGTVTSATLMANGGEFADAVRRALAAPALSVGCHVVLADGSPVLRPFQVPSLIARCDALGAHFYSSWTTFARKALRGQFDPQQIEAEAAAQMRRIQAAGIAVSHFDTHKHLHVLPQVLQPLLRAAAACGVKAVRNPFGRLHLGQLARWPGLWKRTFTTTTMRAWAQSFRRTVTSAGLSTPDGTLGITATGSLDQRMFSWIVEHMPEGTWELVCHPGYNDAQLEAVHTRLRQSRQHELAILTSAETRGLFERNHIALISYRELS
jgi:hopanoid biosynthesis associated protein HpnK